MTLVRDDGGGRLWSPIRCYGCGGYDADMEDRFLGVSNGITIGELHPITVREKAIGARELANQMFDKSDLAAWRDDPDRSKRSAAAYLDRVVLGILVRGMGKELREDGSRFHRICADCWDRVVEEAEKSRNVRSTLEDLQEKPG